MASNRLLKTVTVTAANSKAELYVPQGYFKNLYVNFRGTLDTGEGANLVATDFGHMSKVGVSQAPCRARMDVIEAIGRRKQNGAPMEQDIDTDTLVSWFFPVPISFDWDDENCLYVPASDTVKIDIELTSSATLATRLGSNSLNIDLYGEEVPAGVMYYNRCVNTQDNNVLAGERIYSIGGGLDNVESLGIAYNANISNVIWRSDSRVKCDSGWSGIIQSYLNATHGIEDYSSDAVATTIPYLWLFGNDSRDLAGQWNINNELQIRASSAVNPYLVAVETADYVPGLTQASMAGYRAFTSANLAKVSAPGGNRNRIARTIALIQQLKGAV